MVAGYGKKVLSAGIQSLDDLFLRESLERGIGTVKNWFTNPRAALNLARRFRNIRDIGGGSGGRFNDLANVGLMQQRARNLTPSEVRWYIDPYDANVTGRYNTEHGIIGVNPRLTRGGDHSLSSTVAHEAAHKVQFGIAPNARSTNLPDGYDVAAMKILGMPDNMAAHTGLTNTRLNLIDAETRMIDVINKLKNETNYIEQSRLMNEMKMLGSVVDTLKQEEKTSKFLEYLTRPHEIHSRTMQVRHFLPENLQKGGEVSPDDVLRAFDKARDDHAFNRRAFYYLTDDPIANKDLGIYDMGHAKRTAEWLKYSPAVVAGSALGYLAYGQQRQADA